MATVGIVSITEKIFVTLVGFVLLHTDMVDAIEMTVVTEDTMIVKNLQQNMVPEDTMSFSTDITVLL